MMVLTSETVQRICRELWTPCRTAPEPQKRHSNKMNDSDMGKIKKELNKLKNTGIEGNKLLPLVTQAVGFVGDLAEKFSKLSPLKEQGSNLKAAGLPQP